MSRPSTDELRELVAPSLRHARVDLEDLQWGRGILRLVIDKPGGVTLDDCERVSTAVGAVLDAYDPIAARYRLEVTSPGAERALRQPEDWQTALGKNVRVSFRQGESEMVVEGFLAEISADVVTVVSKRRTRRQEHVVAMSDILSARIVVAI
jgi:ribosome maturation factor RimP